MKFYSYWNNCNYLMTVKVFTIFFFTFYSFWLTVCKHRFDLPQNYIKMKQSGALFFPEKPMQIHYIDVKPSCEVLKSAVHKCTHSMRICTLESSLFLFSSHCFHPHTHTHTHTHTYTPTIPFMSKKPGNGTSVSALINTMNNRGKGCIYTPQNDLVFNKTSYITWKHSKEIVCLISI